MVSKIGYSDNGTKVEVVEAFVKVIKVVEQLLQQSPSRIPGTKRLSRKNKTYIVLLINWSPTSFFLLNYFDKINLLDDVLKLNHLNEHERIHNIVADGEYWKFVRNIP